MVIQGNNKYEVSDDEIFQNQMGEMKIHHWGIAVAKMTDAIQEYKRFGWIWDGEIIEDTDRNVNLAFLHKNNSDEMIELVCAAGEKSPISATLKLMKNISTPYHICYEVEDLEKTIQILKQRHYIVTSAPNPAVAFENRRVAFLLNRDVGLVELLESRKL